MTKGQFDPITYKEFTIEHLQSCKSHWIDYSIPSATNTTQTIIIERERKNRITEFHIIETLVTHNTVFKDENGRNMSTFELDDLVITTLKEFRKPMPDMKIVQFIQSVQNYIDPAIRRQSRMDKLLSR